MGAPFEGTPFVHVARLVAAGRFLFDGFASVDCECAGDGRGDACCVVLCCGTAGALSRATSDLRSQDEVLDVRLGDASGESLADRSDCFRPSNRDEEDLSLMGSNASWKNSWARACDEVGRFRGSHMRHHVTKCARLAGHCGT